MEERDRITICRYCLHHRALECLATGHPVAVRARNKSGCCIHYRALPREAPCTASASPSPASGPSSTR